MAGCCGDQRLFRARAPVAPGGCPVAKVVIRGGGGAVRHGPTTLTTRPALAQELRLRLRTIGRIARPDRPVSLPVRALRVWFALESRFSPHTAERRAARMFATPPRQKARKTTSAVRNTSSRGRAVGRRAGAHRS